MIPERMDNTESDNMSLSQLNCDERHLETSHTHKDPRYRSGWPAVVHNRTDKSLRRRVMKRRTVAVPRSHSEAGSGTTPFGPYCVPEADVNVAPVDRKSTCLNSSHRCISYAVFCLKKKK